MKRIFKQSMLLLTLWGLTACSIDKMGGTEDPANKGEEQLGYLQIGGLSVNTDTEISDLGSSDDITTPATRAVDTNDFVLSIFDATTQQPVRGKLDDNTELGTTFTYSEIQNKKVGVRPGTYYVTAHSPGEVSPTPKENGAYYSGKSQEVAIKSGENNPTVTVPCKLATIIVTVELSADLKRYFEDLGNSNPDRLKTTVTIGDPSNYYIFEKEATRISPVVHFKDIAGPESDGNEMRFVLSGSYYTGDPGDLVKGTPDPSKYKPVTFEKVVQGVKAATYRDIRISIDYNTSGNLEFKVTIDTYVYDDEIEIDSSQSLSDQLEPSIPNDGGEDTPTPPTPPTSEGPAVVWKVNDKAQAPNAKVVIDGSESAVCYITSETGLTGLKVKIDSDVLMKEIKELAMPLDAEMDLFNPATPEQETQLRNLRFLPVEHESGDIDADAKMDDNYRIWDPVTGQRKPGAVSPFANKKSVEFPLTDFMGLLFMFEGEHTFILYPEDASGKNSKDGGLTLSVPEKE